MLTIEELGTAVSVWASEPYIVALAVPMVFYLVGAFSKKIIRDGSSDSSFFVLRDWYLAPDALLVSIGSMLVEVSTLLGKFNSETHRGTIRGVVVLLSTSVCAYLIVLALHRHYESADTHSRKVRLFWLVGVANVIALAVMMMWLVAVKGVNNV
jgi:hypothetical protein